ncbi:MAG TPA: glycosyltransferase family 2 protein [Candidatus Acidoferrum sp.]|jgi:glycosyltransferase involved in cell wall biosynthesis|nr:glycosyltransferase family 2 protein [Candidatus Acidoferrum sp.]
MKNDLPIRYSIVVPFYNEQENISPLYVKLTEVMDAIGERYELVFVDDGSKDKTFKVLSDIYEHDPRVNVVQLRRNFGQAPALKAGFDFARGEVIISMDGDLQHDPEEIPRFLEKIEEGYDLVSGWRISRTDHWLTRQLPSRIANKMMAKLSGVDLHDFGTTFKAYRREVLSEIHLYGELHRFIPALASWAGASVAEVPISNIARRNGSSNYGISRTVRVLLDLMSVKFLLDYSTKPLQFFGLMGLLCLGGGAGIGLWVFLRKALLDEGLLANHGPLMLLGMALVMGGIQFIATGLIGEMLARTYYESQNKPVYSVREFRSRREALAGRDEPPRTAGAGGW